MPTSPVLDRQLRRASGSTTKSVKAAIPERKHAICQLDSEHPLIAAPPVEKRNAAPNSRKRFSVFDSPGLEPNLNGNERLQRPKLSCSGEICRTYANDRLRGAPRLRTLRAGRHCFRPGAVHVIVVSG